MIQFIIPAIVIVIALLAVIVVFARHMRQAAALDLESLPAEQEAAMKAALLERRLKRKMAETKNRVTPLFRRVGQGVAGVFNRMYQRVAQLEQRYRRKPQFMTPAQQQEVKQKIKTLMDNANSSIETGDFIEAEKQYIEALSWDPKNPHTYLALAQMYIAKKEFGQAKETFQFFFKLMKAQKAGEEQISLFAAPMSADDLQQAHFDYGVALQVTGDLLPAKQELVLALKLDENNPRFLDKLVELSILLKDAGLARQTLKTLKSVNPDNQKLSVFEEQIKALS